MIKMLNKCAQIEETTALIYHEFSRNENCDPMLRKIWEDMARDEEEHAHQLKLAMRLPVSDIFDGSKGDGPDLDALNELAGEILQKAKEEDCSLLDMLKDAVVLEKDFRKIHATYALQFKDPGLLKTFEMLAKADHDHLKALDNYLKRYKAEQRK